MPFKGVILSPHLTINLCLLLKVTYMKNYIFCFKKHSIIFLLIVISIISSKKTFAQIKEETYSNGKIKSKGNYINNKNT